jgi:hypothetical protein
MVSIFSGGISAELMLKQLGVVLAEELLHSGWSSLFHGVDPLEEIKDIRGHDQEVAEASWSRVPIGVRRSARNKHAGTRLCLDFVYPDCTRRVPSRTYQASSS